MAAAPVDLSKAMLEKFSGQAITQFKQTGARNNEKTAKDIIAKVLLIYVDIDFMSEQIIGQY